ncbi:MAG: class I SAM-dependent methyltransferase [Vicingaceae bacterium]|nr:class I SAM-dependent methyltransferase [Vicingaceae bacterium]
MNNPNELPWKTENEFYKIHTQRVFKKDTFYQVGMIGKDFEENANYILNKLNLKENDKVVDLGCGSGFLVNKISNICESIGISNSKACIKQAQINYPQNKFEIGNMEDFKINNVSHFVSLETIGYANIEKTFKNVHTSLMQNGVFFIKDVSTISNPTLKEKENINYWKNYWKYYPYEVQKMINVGYKNGFKLLYFKDLITDERLNIAPFLESLNNNIVKEEYPNPGINVHVLVEYIFQKV